eukprot:jgi/Undpi1/11420/HiC_scaffold_30.g13717.m1
MPKVVPTESDPFSDTSDTAQGGAHVEAVSAPIATRVEQTPQGEGGVVGSSTTPWPDSEETIPAERIIGSTAYLPTQEEKVPPVDPFANPSDAAAAVGEDRLHSPSADKEDGKGVLDASNASGISNTAAEPGASTDLVDTDSLLNPSIKPSESQDGQHDHIVNNEGPNENEAGGSVQVLPIPNLYEADNCGDGGGDSAGTFKVSHPNADAPSLTTDDDKSPTDLTGGEQGSNSKSGASQESRESISGASSPTNNTLDTEVCEEGFKRAGAVFARRGTRRFIPRSSQDNANNKPASEKRPSFHAPPAMYMGHPVGSPAAEFLERHERRVKEAAVRRVSVSELLKLVMNHDPVSSGSPMPDVDVVFPDYHSDQNEGDWFV